MNETRKNIQWGQKRRAILVRAAEIFNVHGSRATTFIDIATSLNQTKTSLYYYVKTKDDLIYQCYHMTLDVISEMLDEAEAQSADSKEAIVSFARIYSDHWRQTLSGKADAIAMLTEIQALGETHRKDLTRRYVALMDRLADLVREGRDQGTIRQVNARATARSIMGMLTWGAVWMHRLSQSELRMAVDAVVEIIDRGLRFGAPRGATVRGLSFSDTLKEALEFSGKSEANEKRDAFLKIGTRLFNEKGFKATSLDEIAEVLNATKGAFYYHLKNKDELLLQCFDRSLRLINTTLDVADNEGQTAREKLERAVRYLFMIQHSDYGPLLGFKLLNPLPMEEKHKVLERILHITERFGKWIDAGVKEGSFDSVSTQVAEQLFMGAINTSAEMSDWIKEYSLSKSSAMYVEVLMSGLIRDKATNNAEELIFVADM